MSLKKASSRKRRGFTLMEVMLVLVILVIIAGMAVTALGPIQTRAQMRAARNQIGALRTPMSAYKLDMGDFPPSLQALVFAPAGAEGSWHGPYVDRNIPLDPWGNEYRYSYQSQHGLEYDIWSAGPDRTDGTEDDIGNWTES